MEELKACPCCGGEPCFYQMGAKIVIYCKSCGLKMERSYIDKQTVISNWNKRIN